MIRGERIRPKKRSTSRSVFHHYTEGNMFLFRRSVESEISRPVSKKASPFLQVILFNVMYLLTGVFVIFVGYIVPMRLWEYVNHVYGDVSILEFLQLLSLCISFILSSYATLITLAQITFRIAYQLGESVKAGKADAAATGAATTVRPTQPLPDFAG